MSKTEYKSRVYTDRPDYADFDALYSRETIDRKLREIIGDELIPWEQRYKAQINPARNRAERRAQKRRNRF